MNLRQAAKRWFMKNDEPQRMPAPTERLETTRRVRIEREPERPGPPRAYVDIDYVLKVREAWEQWQAAQKFFESVCDPELVEYAIYDLEATRRRYIYMLKQADALQSAGV